MTLQLALVIGGDNSGANKALQDTAAGVETVGKKVSETAGKAADLGRGLDDAAKAADATGGKFGWLSEQAEEARTGIKAAADESKGASTSLKDITPAADGAAGALGRVGSAAENSVPKFGAFKAAAIGFIGGIAGGLAGAALGAGIEAITGKFIELAREVASDTPRIERDLKSHAELVRAIKGAYAEAEGAASSYGNNSTAILRFQAQQNVTRLERDYKDSVPDGGLFNVGVFGSGAGAFNDQQLGPFAAAVKAFRKDLQEGKSDVIAFRTEIANIAETLPADSKDRTLAETIFGDTQQAAEVLAELRRSRDLLSGLKGDADAAATALGGSAEKFTALGQSGAGANTAVTGAASAIDASAQAAAGALPNLQEYDALMRSIAGRSAVRDAVTPLVGGDRPTEKFAAGGVVDRPTFFAFDGGKTGLMGEAGAEAILPLRGGMVRARGESGRETSLALTRLADGSLGVEMPTAFARGGVVSRFAAGGVVMSAGGVSGGYDQGDDSWGIFADSLKGGFQGILTELLQSARSGDFKDFWENFGQIGIQIADRLFSHWADQLVDGLSSALAGAFSGKGAAGGFAGGFDWGSLFSPSFTPNTTLGAFLGFEQGGWTGSGDESEPAGIVHRKEFVVRAPVVAKPGVRQFLQALNNGRAGGYQGGGYVESVPYPAWTGGSPANANYAPPKIVINNNAAVQVDHEETTDERGGRQSEFTISDTVGSALAKKGGGGARTLKRVYGITPKRIQR